MKKILLPSLLLLLASAFKLTGAPVKSITGKVSDKTSGRPLAGIHISAIPGSIRVSTDKNGKYAIEVSNEAKKLVFSFPGFKNDTVKIDRAVINIALERDPNSLNEVVIVGFGTQKKSSMIGSIITIGATQHSPRIAYDGITEESYNSIKENAFNSSFKKPLSTFSIDVDGASYSNVRRFLNNGGLPPADAVRIEEMINYFDYDYPGPTANDPINIITEISNAPWNTNHRLVKIGLQGRKISADKLPASNLVFLIDVSGSMSQPNKLPLLVSSFKLLSDQLRPQDKVAIVVYAGQAGLALPSTPGDQTMKIKEALGRLSAGGSTAGGQGIELAYKVAGENFIKEGNNRVILATDGDFNVGSSSDKDMEKLIEEKRKSGIFLTALGFGMGNYKDSKLETLADKGNGNYAYIDNITEARKVLISEFGGTLFTIAKDVKLQVEFNPAKAQAYRLIGYENRMLKSRDFNDDQKDAGELGAGHTVTALYEVIPTGVKSTFAGDVDELKYQVSKQPKSVVKDSKELMTIKLRYKTPDGNVSKLMEHPVIDVKIPLSKTSDNFRFSAAVAEFGMLLKQSDYKQNATFESVIANAQKAMGEDNEGYRAEFVKLAKSAKLLAKDLLGMNYQPSSNDKK